MNRTHKIALNPAPAHQRLLDLHADSAREGYNCMLAHFNKSLTAGKPCPVGMLFPIWQDILAARYPQYKNLCPSAAQYAVYALGGAIKAWENSDRDNEFPQPHGPDHRPAFRADEGEGSVNCEGKRIELPGIGTVRMRESLRLEGRVSTVTITYEVGRWWACVAVERKDPPRICRSEAVGVDVGVGTMAVCSDGKRFEVPEALRLEWRRIGRYRKQLARQLPGSNRQKRVQRKLERASYRAKCLRDEAQYEATREIVTGDQVVVMETLDVVAMMQKGAGRLTKGIAAAAMSAMQRKIADRCDALGVEWMKADPDFPSSRLCSGCKALQDMPLGKKIYDCPSCAMSKDRDENAALNLKLYGEKKIKEGTRLKLAGARNDAEAATR